LEEKMKKILLVLIALMALSTQLFAGGGQAASSSGKTEIRASYWGDTRRFDLYSSIISEFEKVYPNVSVIREPVSWNDYWDKLSVAVAGGNATDFMCMHPQFYADYVPRGVLESLDKYVSDKTLSLDGWAQSIIDTGKYNGQLYMVPMGLVYSSAFVNSGVFKQLGVTPPSFEWSWDEAKELGLQVRRAFDAQGKRDSWMIGNQITSLNNFRYFARQRNRELYNAQGNIAVTQQDIQDWFTMWKEWQDLGITPDGATDTEFRTATLEQGLFASDRVLVSYVPCIQIWLYGQTFPNKEINIVRHPGSKGSAYVGEFPEGAHYGVYARTTPEKKLAAAQLLNFWLNDERSLKLYQHDQGVPGNAPVFERAVMPLLHPTYKPALDFVNTLNRISRPTIFPPPGASEIDALFLNKAQMVQFGAGTPAAAAKEFYDEAVAIRQRASR
jgi:multiple sugar transport system substrate-binding protein